MKKGRRPRRRPRLKLSDKAGPDQCPVPGENALFPAQIAGFLAVSRPVPVYPVFLNYVVPVQPTCRTVTNFRVTLSDPGVSAQIQPEGFVIENASDFSGNPVETSVPSVSIDGDELILTLSREFQFYKSDGNTPFLITIANYKGRSKTIFSRKNKNAAKRRTRTGIQRKQIRFGSKEQQNARAMSWKERLKSIFLTSGCDITTSVPFVLCV